MYIVYYNKLLNIKDYIDVELALNNNQEYELFVFLNNVGTMEFGDYISYI